jgi:hypothetical protein
MLNNIVRRLFRNLDMELNDEQCIAFIKAVGLNKLPLQYVVILGTVMPILEMVFQKLRNENIDWGDLAEME